MLSDQAGDLRSRTSPSYSGGVPSHYGIGRNVTHHHAACSNESKLTNFDPAQDRGVCPMAAPFPTIVGTVIQSSGLCRAPSK
jgi:hypothetical protein